MAAITLLVMTSMVCAIRASAADPPVSPERVRITNNPQAVTTCASLGPIHSWVDSFFTGASSTRFLMNRLRAQAAEKGGNVVVLIGSITTVTQRNGSKLMADGEVYRCAAAATPVRDVSTEAIAPVPADPSTAGPAPTRPAPALSPAPGPVASRSDVAVLAPPSAGAAPDRPGEPLVRVLEIPFEKAWAVTQMALKTLRWTIDEAKQEAGVILTDSEPVEFQNLGLFAEGTRHRLLVTVKPMTDGRSVISVSRELYAENRKLWITERKPLQPADTSIEERLLEAIRRLL
jgi:hypothetical protein